MRFSSPKKERKKTVLTLVALANLADLRAIVCAWMSDRSNPKFVLVICEDVWSGHSFSVRDGKVTEWKIQGLAVRK